MKLLLTVAGLLLHLHQCFRAEGSSGTVYKGTSVSFFTPETSLSEPGLWTEAGTAWCRSGTLEACSHVWIIFCGWRYDWWYFLWSQGEFEAGKYRCLICNKEFNSESGVKYHINSIHSEVSDVLLWSPSCDARQVFLLTFAFPPSAGLVCDEQKSLQEVWEAP